MYQSIPDRGARRGRWASVALLLIGLGSAYALVAEPGARFTDNPNAGQVPVVLRESPPIPAETLAKGASLEELLSQRSSCPCTYIGDCLISYTFSNVFRGNIYQIDPEGTNRVLCSFCMRLNIPAGTELCFFVYEGDDLSGSYTQTGCWRVTPPGSGWDYYCSGQIDLELTAGLYYLIGVAWDDVSVTFCMDSVSYAAGAEEEFGKVYGWAGFNQGCADMEETENVSRQYLGAYAQQVCFMPKPGACCTWEGACVDTLPGGDPMDYATCVDEPYNGEFTNIGVTCDDLAAAGHTCTWLADNHWACCWQDECQDANPYFCDYIGEYLPGGGSEYHEGLECATEICDPRGTCCIFDGGCEDYVTESECYDELDGVTWYDPFDYPDMICAIAPCTASGACCFGASQCVELSEAACINLPGEYQGDGYHCDPEALICVDIPGACCLIDSCVDGVTQYECEVELSGTYQGDWYYCSMVDCPTNGACCDGPNCTVTTYDVCTNGGVSPEDWHKGESCDPGPCLPLGACCVADECVETNAMECYGLEGDFTLGESCMPNPCPQVGACCLPTGCELMEEADCLSSNGVFAGVGVPCGWACNPGACCLRLGPEPELCVDTVQIDCLNSNGEFRGAFTACSDFHICHDCNTNEVWDATDIAQGTSDDCNTNWIPDECDLDAGTSPDCNLNLVPDECDVAGATSDDYDLNGVPDECDTDCNTNGVPDACDLDCGIGDCASHPLGCGTSADCQSNGIPDECDTDCNATGVPDDCETIEAGDWDADGNVDLDDFLAFGDCMGGPGVLPNPASPECVDTCVAAFDFDPADNDVDLADFAAFQRAFEGP